MERGTAEGPTETRREVFVARQPIFDRHSHVFGYELLFRSGLANFCPEGDGDGQTRSVIHNSFVDIGLDELTAGKLAFVNFTRNTLLAHLPEVLPPQHVAVEILEGVEPDPAVIDACRRLRQAGYTLVLDDCSSFERAQAFTNLASIVKVDFSLTSPADRKKLARRLVGRGITPLAEKVETQDEFQDALSWGYEYFQGYFFSRPVIRAARTLTPSQAAHLQLMGELARPELSYEQLEDIIRRDLALTYRLLRFINSTWLALRHKVASVKHALILLGPRELRRWHMLMALREMGQGKPDELLLLAVARGRMAEELGRKVQLHAGNCDLFLLGLFSVIDALLDMPMNEVLDQLPLDDQVKAALLGQDGSLRALFDAIICYETGQWAQFSSLAQQLALDEAVMPGIYSSSLQWAQQALACAAD